MLAPLLTISRRPPAIAMAIFFSSGVAALAYEVAWSRMIGLTLGNTAQAAALVLASYFTGLSLGTFLGGRIAIRFQPLIAYAIAELFAATWACCIPRILVTINVFESESLRVVACFGLLLPGTIALGATFPLMAEHLSRQGRRIVLAYSLNTLGGLLGLVLATAFIVSTGVTTSSYLASIVSVGCGIIAFMLPRQPPCVARGDLSEKLSFAGYALAAISGFGALGLEVLFTRQFALVFHNSTYSFAAVIAVFLAALSLGASVVSLLGRRVSSRNMAVAGCLLGSIVLAGSVPLFANLTQLNYFKSGGTFTTYMLCVVGLVIVVVLPPVTLLGMVLPAILTTSNEGREASRFIAVNTIGAAIGALVAGFVLMPNLGLWESFGFFAILFGVTSVVILLRDQRYKLASAATAIVATAVGFLNTSPPQNPGPEVLERRWQSTYGWIDVVRNPGDGSLRLRQNLHYRHGSTANATREYRQGRLPLLLHRMPKEVAFLGLGTGLTAAPVVVDSFVYRAVIVELIPEVVEAARLFSRFNAGVVDHTKVEIRIDDARHFLSRTHRHFDVIVADLFVPWESRAGYLYTAEFYAAARSRLKPGGLFCQWVALYQVGAEEWELIADTFASVFPITTLWWGQFDAQTGMVALIGSESPLGVDATQLESRFQAMNQLPGGNDPDLGRPMDLPGLDLGRWPIRPNRRLNTDEHPRLEFTAPISQQSGRTLKGHALREYFDRVFVHLPASGVRFSNMEDSGLGLGHRRAAQRLSLFATESP